MGTYEIRTLRITLGIRSVEVVPKSRYVVATIAPPGLEPCRADGMVELTDGGMADHYVFRLVVGGEDRWYIRSVGLWNTDDKRTVETLDRDRFEAAVLYTLQ